MTQRRKVKKIIFKSGYVLLSIICCLFFLTGCSSSGGRGDDGGALKGIFRPGVYESCEKSTKSSSSSGANINVGDAWTNPDGKTGTLVEIPEDCHSEKAGYTVTYYTHKGVHKDNTDMYWNEGTTSREIHDKWNEAGDPMDEDGLCTLNGRYLVACAERFGKPGDLVDFKLKDGKVLPCYICDAKSPNDSNYTEWGHKQENGAINIIEFQLHWDRKENTNPGSACKQEWHQQVIAAMCYGNVNPGSTNSSSKNNKCKNKTADDFDYLIEAKRIADDESHGYSQSNRMLNPDVDCSSFVYYSLKNCNYNVGDSPFSTNNEESATAPEFTAENFVEANAKRGDIVMNDGHTEFVWEVSGGKITKTIGAHEDKDGASGDSSGKEVCIVDWNQNWTRLLHPINPHGVNGDENMSENGRRIVEAARNTPCPGLNLCATWVSNVIQNAGFPRPGGNGNSMLDGHASSEDFSNIEPGEVVSAQYGVGSMGMEYGHVGIYIGNGQIMHSTGTVQTESLDSWRKTYGRGWVKHGWIV